MGKLSNCRQAALLENGHCTVEMSVSCPGSGEQCKGNQCCPRTKESGDKTFPCPSANSTYTGCESDTKLSNCRQAALLENGHCTVETSVSCPGSGEQCKGNQCCPRTKESGDKTFPCPSANSTYTGCESDTKLSNCRQAALLEN